MKHFGSSMALIAVLACTPKTRSESNRPALLQDEATLTIFKTAAKQTGLCSKEKEELIQAHEALLKTWIAQIHAQLSHNLPPSQHAPLDIGEMAAHYYQRPENATLGNDIVGIVKSEGFAQMLNDTSIWLTTLADNQELLNRLVKLKDELAGDEGTPIARILNVLATHRVAQRDILSSLKILSGCKNTTDQDLTNLLYLPDLIPQIGPEAFALLRGPLFETLIGLQKQHLNPPESLVTFLNLAQKQSNRIDICTISSLKPYRPLLNMLAFSASNRHGFQLLDFAVQFLSLSEANNCHVRTLQQIESEDLKKTLLRLAELLKSAKY